MPHVTAPRRSRGDAAGASTVTLDRNVDRNMDLDQGDSGKGRSRFPHAELSLASAPFMAPSMMERTEGAHTGEKRSSEAVIGSPDVAASQRKRAQSGVTAEGRCGRRVAMAREGAARDCAAVTKEVERRWRLSLWRSQSREGAASEPTRLGVGLPLWPLA